MVVPRPSKIQTAVTGKFSAWGCLHEATSETSAPDGPSVYPFMSPLAADEARPNDAEEVFRPATVLAAVFSGLVAVVVFTTFPAATRGPLTAALSVSVVASATLATLSFNRRLPHARLPDVVLGLASLLATVGLYGVHLGGGLLLVTSLVLVVVGTAVLVGTPRHYLAFCVVVSGGFLVHALRARAPERLAEALGLFGAMAFGGLLLSVRSRTEARLAAFAAQAVRQRHELVAALDRSRGELADRERLEREREGLREQLAHAQRLEAIGSLAGGVAHDMNNTLGAILGTAEALAESPTPDVRDNALAIVAAARRGAELTRNLLGYARKGKNQVRPMRLARVLRDVETLLARSLSRQIRVSSNMEDRTLVVDGDVAQLSHALLNLGINAAEALDQGGEIHLSMRPRELGADRARSLGVVPGRYAEVCVEDDGPGISPDVARQAFEPFFTTKVGGTGLGLSMVWGMAKSHGGAVQIGPAGARGTRVQLLLPLSDRRPFVSERPPTPTANSPTSGRRTRALLVDDDAAVRATTARMLRRLGFQVFEAGDGAEALAVHAREGRIGLAVVDVAMPVMGGAECFEQLRAREPSLPILLVSGFAPDGEVQRALALGGGAFLEKPFGVQDLARSIEQLLEPPRTSESLVVATLASEPALKRLAQGPFDGACPGRS